MARKNLIILQILTFIMIVIMLLFMGSLLKPYLALFLAIVMLILIVLWSKYKKSRFLLVTLIVVLFSSALFTFFPIKFVFANASPDLIRIIPIGYGLPSGEGWSQIEQGIIYPGGDILYGPFNPKYVIMIGI